MSTQYFPETGNITLRIAETLGDDIDDFELVNNRTGEVAYLAQEFNDVIQGFTNHDDISIHIDEPGCGYNCTTTVKVKSPQNRKSKWSS